MPFCFPITDRKNKANLEAIEKAVFVLCLDQPPPHSTQSPSVMENPTCSVTARQSLHGDGTEYNSCNRWFDKIVQVPHTELWQSMKPIVLIQSCFVDTSRFDTNLSSETAQQFRSHHFLIKYSLCVYKKKIWGEYELSCIETTGKLVDVFSCYLPECRGFQNLGRQKMDKSADLKARPKKRGLWF